MSEYAWEPGDPGFIRDDPIALASALEALRRQTCAYGSTGEQTCDCKYGLSAEARGGSEQTGCPELRVVILGLLHPDRLASARRLPWGDSKVLPREES